MTGQRVRKAALLALVAGVVGGWFPAVAAPAAAQTTPITRVDPGDYDVYIPTATKEGQFYSYTCEFDAAWVVLKTFGHDVSFEEQLEIVGLDRDPEPYYVEGPEGFVIYGGDITTAFSGDYTKNLLARTTGRAMQPLFEHYGLPTVPVRTADALQAALRAGALAWMKATVDFLPWAPTTWVTPQGEELPTVLGNDHAVVVMGYNAAGPVIRDVLGPTDTNWNRLYEYDVPWDTFLAVWGAQGFDALAVYPPGTEGVGGESVEGRADPEPPAEERRVCC